jgi:hypothetical protein
MRRVLVYFEYKAAWWVERSGAEGREVTPQLAEGLRAYANSQAQLQRDIALKFQAKWEVLRRDGVTTEELDRLATVAQEGDDQLDGNETGSEEEDYYSDEGNDVGLIDDDFDDDG